MWLIRFFLVTLGLYGCYGNDDGSISHLVLLDKLPLTFSGNVTPELIIRTNFSGEIEFREAETFKVLLNVTAPSIQEAYAVTSDLVEDKGKLLLQVYEKRSVEPVITLRWIFLLIGCFTGVVLFFTVLYTIWWYTTGKHKELYYNQNFLGSGYINRSRNSMRLGAAAGELQGDEDHHMLRSAEELEKDRKLLDLRVTLPDTIPEETEGDSSEDDPVYRSSYYHGGKGSSSIKKNFSLSLHDKAPSSENNYGSGIMDYPDQSGDELDNDISPEQKIADADGNYTPLDEIDDILTDGNRSNSQRNFVPNPKGNLESNFQASKSDGELVREFHQKLAQRNKMVPTTSNGEIVRSHSTKGSPQRSNSTKGSPQRSNSTKGSPQRSNNRDHYRPGLNLPPIDNDVRKAPVKVMAQVHTPEKIYAGSQQGQGQYVNLVPAQNRLPRTHPPPPPPPLERQEILDMYTYPSDIPMMTFKGPSVSPIKEPQGRPIPKPKPKPKPIFTGGSPTSPGGFDYGKLEPNFTMKSNEPISPGSFSMLSEGSSSSMNDERDRQGDFLDFDDSDADLRSPGREGDLISNASLPLPSPPPMDSQFMQYDTYGAISQLSPRQSLVSPDDKEKEYGTMIAITGSPSPGGPFSRHSVNQAGPDGNLFVFPPPPNIYQPPQETAWSRRELFTGENQERPEQVPEEARSRERRQSGGRRGGKAGLKHLHLTILSTLCLLSLMSGVYSALTSHGTNVNIIVYVPKGFTAQNVTIYSALNKDVDVKNNFRTNEEDELEKIDWFVSDNPTLLEPSSMRCQDNTCTHGCDENTGNCICRMGYRMEKGTCKDVNECLEGKAKCLHPEAGCIDTDGSYICHCSGHLYGDGRQCYECAAPCLEGSYEIQPCTRTRGKICSGCTKSCGGNYFMKTPCGLRSDAVCLMCQPKCDVSQREFEHSQCNEAQDRECKSMEKLPPPKAAKNMILDDLTVVRDETVELIYLPSAFDGARRFLFERGLTGSGSDFWIEVTVKALNPMGMFRTVNHSDSMPDPSWYPGPQEVLWKHCRYPVPPKYKLSYTIHEDSLYTTESDTDKGQVDISPCSANNLSFPTAEKTEQSQSIFCTEPNILSKIFNISHTASLTKWLENSLKDCRESHQACENCSGDCARKLTQSPGCSVSENDNDGRSPRLPLCYTCCMESDCKSKCRDYHDDKCRLTRCQNGAVVEFKLESVYPTSDTFYCHVEQVLNQTLIKLEYRVKHYHSTLLQKEFIIRSDEEWQKTGHVFKKDNIINIEIDGKLDPVPNFIQWAIGVPNIRVGMYKEDGFSLRDTALNTKSIFIRPRKPFGISPKKFGDKNCQDDLLDDVVISRELEDPYRIMSDLLAKDIDGETGLYLITNKTKAPIVHIGINKDTSILRAIFNETHLMFDWLKGNMVHNSTHWVLNITGKIETCPGFLNLNVTDPAYPSLALFQFDVGVYCPEEYTKPGVCDFSLEFAVPTGDSNSLSKDLQVHIRDKSATYHLTVHASSGPQAKGEHNESITTSSSEMTSASEEDQQIHSSMQQQAPPHFSILFVAAVLGAILILLLLLMFGVAWKQGIPEGPILRFRILHLFLLCSYITFQFIYAMFVSMTIFVLVIVAVNGEATTFMKQYNRQSSVKTALSQLELDQMESHLRLEILRQNSLALDRRTECEAKMRLVMDDLSMLKDKIENITTDEIHKKNISEMIRTHTKTAIGKFSSDLLLFRDQYSLFVSFVLRKLKAEVASTYHSIDNSTWLRGAKYLLGNMELMRTYFGSATTPTPFMEWVNMDTDIMKWADGLALPLPDLPLLQEELPTPELNTLKSGLPSVRLTKPLATDMKNAWVIQPQWESEVSPPKPSRQTDEQMEKHIDLKLKEYMIFFIIMVCIDVLWLLHRMIKAVGIGKLLLYGYPIYVDVRDKKEETPLDEFDKTKRQNCSVCKDVLFKVLSTFFIPKLIGTMFVCLMVYLISFSALNFINRKTFSYLGYYNDMEDLMSLNGAVINSRLQTHAYRINRLELPMYESMMNTHIQSHQHILSMVELQWWAIQDSHTQAYCTYLKRINVTADCHSNQGQGLTEVKVDSCRFSPVDPILYDRNMSASSKVAAEQLDGFLINIQHLVSNTCQVILVYLAAIVIKELLSTVLWIFIKRSGIVSLRIIYETDEIPGTADNSTSNK